MVGAQSQKPMVFKISSISLAGSHLSLPKYIPYSVHEFGHLMELEETETERSNFDYTRENKSVDKKIDMPKKMEKKKIKRYCFMNCQLMKKTRLKKWTMNKLENFQ